MKKFLLFSALFLFSSFFGVEVSAQNVFSVEDITIKPGETKKVSINFANEADQVIGFSVVMQFPEWVTLKNLAIVNDRTNDEDKPDLSFNSLGDGKYKLWYQSSDTEQFWITGNSGAVFTFDLTAKDTAPAGESFTVEIPTLNKMFNYDMDVIDYSFSPFTITVGGAATAEDITLANEWNTYCSTNDLDFAHVKVEVYVVSEVTATSAKLEAVTVVPAGVGFLIKGTANDKFSVPFAKSAGSVTSKLVGVTEDTPLEGGNYVLSGDQFVLCSEGGTLPAHKAYLPGELVTSGAKAFGFDFGDATGINEAKAAKADGTIYSISGVRVAQPQKGVYIMNGRKVIVK